MANEKKIPLRKCVACQERKPKRELVRVVADPERGPIIDASGKANGRGAYLCRDAECIAKAKKRNTLKHALKTNVQDAFYEEILHYVER